MGVKNEGAEGGVGAAFGRGNAPHDGLQHTLHVCARFGADGDHVFGGNAGEVFDFFGDVVGEGCRQINFIDDGNQLQVSFHRQVQIRQRLRLDTLSGIDDQNSPLARLKSAADLVAEIYVAGGVDQVHDVLFAIVGVVDHAHGGRFDGDALFPFDVHGIQHLRLHFAVGYGSG